MKLTPLEVRKQSFRKTMRGFDPEEVRIFLDMVADEYERVLQENGMLSEKVRYLSERLEEYHNLEKTLQSSILTAERIAAESREQSRSEAESIINDAHVRSERILEDSRSRLRLLGEQIHHLSRQKELFLQRFQDLLDGQNQFLGSHRDDLKTIDELDARAESLVAETTPIEEEPPAGADPAERRMEESATDAFLPTAGPRERSRDELHRPPSEEALAEAGEVVGVGEERERPVLTGGSGEGPGRDPEVVRPRTGPHQQTALGTDSANSPDAGPGPARHEEGPARREEGPARHEEGPARREEDEEAPRRERTAYHEPRSREADAEGEADDDAGFFRPRERAEGFFEINAEEGARK